jgi:CMP/dCMP kinase
MTSRAATVPVVVAIDGPAGSGKSTLGRALATALGADWAYLDTGAMYRAVTVEALRRGVPLDAGAEGASQVAALARDLDLHVDRAGRVRLGAEDVTEAIRSADVNSAVSLVAANPEVRLVMREHQRRFAREHGRVVAEGRDIGSVVFPDAVLKVFLDANEAERVRRRVEELRAKEPGVDASRVRDALIERDLRDTGREVDPLVRARDAVAVDTTGLTPAQVVDRVVALVLSRVPPVAGR